MATAHICSQRMVNAFAKFNDDLEAFRKETGDDLATLYEDAYTSRNVRAFRLSLAGTLTWNEDGHFERETMFDDDEARDFLSFWRACLRRAKRYWSMDTETLDKIQDPESGVEDKDED